MHEQKGLENLVYLTNSSWLFRTKFQAGLLTLSSSPRIRLPRLSPSDFACCVRVKNLPDTRYARAELP